jgi:hypothetical protein
LVLICSSAAACGGEKFKSSGTDGGGNGGSAAGSAGAGAGGAVGGSGGSAGADAGVAGAGGTHALAVVHVSPTSVSTSEVPSLTLDPSPSAGNAIIVGITCMSDYQGDCIIGPNGLSDNQGNFYTLAVQSQPILSSAQAARGYIFIAENIAAPNGTLSISVDPEGSTTLQSVVWGAIEVSGIAAAASLDAWGISLAGASNSTTAATDLETVQADELAVAVLSMRSEDTNMLITPEPTWQSHHSHQNGANGPPGHSMISKLLTATGTVTHTWTHDIPTRGATGIIATFKSAATN